MRAAAIFVTSALFLIPAHPHTVAAAEPELACETLDGTALDACIAKQAKSEVDQLTPIFKNAAVAEGDACSSVPAPAIGACLEKAQDAADATLNQVYKKAVAAIKEQAGSKGSSERWEQQLKASQSKWIAFRDADCGDLVFSEFQNGTGAGPASIECLLDKTLMRAQELQHRYIDR